MRADAVLAGTWLVLAIVSCTSVFAQPRPAGLPEPTHAAAQPPRSVVPAPAPDASLARWIDIQAATLGLVFRQIDNGAHQHTLNAMQWSPTVRTRLRLDPAARYTVSLGIQGGRSFKLSWNGTGVGSQDFMHDLPLRHLYVSAAPVAGLTLHAGSLPLVRGESSEITTYDNDGYVVGERVVLTRRSALFFDEIAFTNAWLGDYTLPSVFDRTSGLADRNYRQLSATRRVSAAVSFSVDYSSHAGAQTLRQAIALRAPRRLGLDLIRLEQYARVEPDTAHGFAVVGEKSLTPRLRLAAGLASIDGRYGTWNGDRYNVGDHVFVQGTVPVLGYVSFMGFFGREVHAPETSANLNRIDVQVSYDALAHWRASRRR